VFTIALLKTTILAKRMSPLLHSRFPLVLFALALISLAVPMLAAAARDDMSYGSGDNGGGDGTPDDWGAPLPNNLWIFRLLFLSFRIVLGVF